MPTVEHAHSTFCAVGGSTAHSVGGYGVRSPQVKTAAGGLGAHSGAAASASCSFIVQLHRQYPAGFATVAAAVASAGQLEFLQDPLWLAAISAVHAWQHSTNVETRRTTEAARISAAAGEGSSVAAAIREAALEVGEGDPLLRLQAAALLGEAAALLHCIGDGLAVSSVQKPVGGNTSTVLGSDHSQRMAASAGRAASALELWYFRLMALPVSVSVVSLGSREGAPWKPRPCCAFSGVAATPQLQLPAATDELLLLNQQVRVAIRFLATVEAYTPEEVQPLHLRCMQALQQAQQLTLQLALPGEAVTTEAASQAAAPAAAADTSVFFPDNCGGVALPILSSSRPQNRRMDWQLLLRGRRLQAAPVPSRAWSTGGKVQHRQPEVLHSWPKQLAWPLCNFLWILRSICKRQTAHEVLLSRGLFLPTASPHWRGEYIGCTANVQAGSTVESTFLLRHAAKLHALLTSSRRPELALR